MVRNVDCTYVTGDRTLAFFNQSPDIDIRTLRIGIRTIDTAAAGINKIIELYPASDRGNYR